MPVFFKILYILGFLLAGFFILITCTDYKYKFEEFIMRFTDKDFHDIEQKVFEKDYYIITKYMSKQVSQSRIPVIELYFENKVSFYRIVGYEHYVSFVRCTKKELIPEEDYKIIKRESKKQELKIKWRHPEELDDTDKIEESDEVMYSSLDELFHADLIDGICLERDWGKLVNRKLMTKKINQRGETTNE